MSRYDSKNMPTSQNSETEKSVIDLKVLLLGHPDNKKRFWKILFPTLPMEFAGYTIEKDNNQYNIQVVYVNESARYQVEGMQNIYKKEATAYIKVVDSSQENQTPHNVHSGYTTLKQINCDLATDQPLDALLNCINISQNKLTKEEQKKPEEEQQRKIEAEQKRLQEEKQRKLEEEQKKLLEKEQKKFEAMQKKREEERLKIQFKEDQKKQKQEKKEQSNAEELQDIYDNAMSEFEVANNGTQCQPSNGGVRFGFSSQNLLKGFMQLFNQTTSNDSTPNVELPSCEN